MVEKLLNSRIPLILWSRAGERGRLGELEGERERDGCRAPTTTYYLSIFSSLTIFNYLRFIHNVIIYQNHLISLSIIS
jgi:hypothetical protein